MREKTTIHIFWCGPPPVAPGPYAGQDELGPEFLDRHIDYSRQRIIFHCCARYQADYVNKHSKRNIEVRAIEAELTYLLSHLSHEDRAFRAPVIQLLQYLQDEEAAFRVEFPSRFNTSVKEACAFLWLYFYGGYVMDSNVVPALRCRTDQKFSLPPCEQLSLPLFWTASTGLRSDVFVMGAPEGGGRSVGLQRRGIEWIGDAFKIFMEGWGTLAEALCLLRKELPSDTKEKLEHLHKLMGYMTMNSLYHLKVTEDEVPETVLSYIFGGNFFGCGHDDSFDVPTPPVALPLKGKSEGFKFSFDDKIGLIKIFYGSHRLRPRVGASIVELLDSADESDISDFLAKAGCKNGGNRAELIAQGPRLFGKSDPAAPVNKEEEGRKLSLPEDKGNSNS
ncbi:MAG: hypothetical protein A3E84_00595 [Gammaproteobacteria bacterium RIFCSPHIGHO2_12_FULL_42_13]|nr:MAG: hypothetical protein A3E84_00595 [Gammaproteobacteria bacterium RIFCSPHIGHO2_12_FULL_42_13]